jgi:tRNA-Thr(GGU) m(6)t(6)A37 methyltransferase TsaA
MRESLSVNAIGVVRSQFLQASGTPIQPTFAGANQGKIIVNECFAPALDDIAGFERIWLIYWMDRTVPFKPRVTPFLDTREHGLFATRSPCRPNPIGLSAVRLLRHEGNVLHVADLDILDGTPLLDIKPYVPAFDAHPLSRAGWFDNCRAGHLLADDRFEKSTDL